MERISKKVKRNYGKFIFSLLVFLVWQSPLYGKTSCEVYRLVGINGADVVSDAESELLIRRFDCRITFSTSSINRDATEIRTYRSCGIPIDGSELNIGELGKLKVDGFRSDSKTQSFRGLVEARWKYLVEWHRSRSEGLSELAFVEQSSGKELNLQFEIVPERNCQQEIVDSLNSAEGLSI